MEALNPLTWFAVCYALTLLGTAYGIDRMAKRAAARLEETRTSGFVYHADHDAWICPEDHWLWPQSFDPDNRVMRYRGNPSVCNSCPVRETCTTSDSGRELQRAIDPWPASESARFHRGIACTVSVLAAAWPLATVFMTDTAADTLTLVSVVVLVLVASLPLWSHLHHSPADPLGVLARSSEENLADRTAVATKHSRRRTSYWSDRRESVRREKGENL